MTGKPLVRAIAYNGLELEETLLVHPREAIALVTERDDRVVWIHVHGLHHEPTVRELGMIFDVHPVALEDAMGTVGSPGTELEFAL